MREIKILCVDCAEPMSFDNGFYCKEHGKTKPCIFSKSGELCYADTQDLINATITERLKNI